MSKYSKLKKKYDDLIKQTLEKNKRILIDSFIEYYGEEFRYKIESRYNEITFVYYIDWGMVDLVINEFLPQIDNTNKYVDFINFSNSRIKSPLSRIFEKQKHQSDLPDNLIGMTNTSVLKKDAIVRWLFEILSECATTSYNYGSVNHMDRMVSFQILSLNECAIIHEINHAITRDNLIYIFDDDFSNGRPVSKVGLSLGVARQSNGERNIEELINEKSSEEIEKIFKSKGGDLSSFCLNIPLVYAYKYNLYLIDDFYMRFKKYIKIARISDNKNELISRIGQSEYEEFVKLVNMCYTSDITQVELYKENALPLIRKMVDKMNKNLNNSSTPTIDEINVYLEQLKKSEYDLRMIDNLQNQPEDFKRK